MLAKYGIQGIRFNIRISAAVQMCHIKIRIDKRFEMQQPGIKPQPNPPQESTRIEGDENEPELSQVEKRQLCLMSISNLLMVSLFSSILLKDPQKIQSQTSPDSRFPTNTSVGLLVPCNRLIFTRPTLIQTQR
jgi:hypothetical protein